MLLLVEQECDLVLGTLTHQILVSQRTHDELFWDIHNNVLSCPEAFGPTLPSEFSFSAEKYENVSRTSLGKPGNLHQNLEPCTRNKCETPNTER